MPVRGLTSPLSCWLRGSYRQNKAFTKHIVDALMQSNEEKLELEVSVPRKLSDEWEPTIKIKIKRS